MGRLIYQRRLVALTLLSALVLAGCARAVPSREPRPATAADAGAGAGLVAVDAGARPGGDSPRPPAVAEPPSAAEPSPPAGGSITLAVVGDLMFARGVATAIAREGVEYPLAAVAERLRAADLTVANLESPIGEKGRPLPGKGIWFRARPEAVAALTQAGIDAVTVANNHILDYDTENFLETLVLLRDKGIAYFGGGETLAEARRPTVLEAGGVRVAFLGYSQFAHIFWDWNYRRTFAATDTVPGVAPIDEATLADDIERARQEADVVAVAYHWGDEYVNYPNQIQKDLAHRTIDLGADLVLGFHPHAIQGLERYRGGLIAYSLGNFVMDQRRDVTKESMILDVRLTREGVQGYEVTPVIIEAAQPRVAEGEAGRRLREKIERISAGLSQEALQPKD